MTRTSLAEAASHHIPPAFRLLSMLDVAEMMRLQKTVQLALPEEEQSAIVLKSPTRFQALLAEPHFGIGVFAPDGMLVGQMIVAVTTGFKDGHGLIACEASRALLEGHPRSGVVQSVLVHPAWRKQGLMTGMLAEANGEAATRRVAALVAEIAAYNKASAAGFLHHGYQVAGRGEDPVDGTPLLFLHHPVSARATPSLGMALDSLRATASRPATPAQLRL